MAGYPLVVLVNGLPGSGKSTLARPLAGALGLPLFAKDVIKETWADFLGSEALDGRPRREWSMLLGAAASETVWNLLADSPIGGIVDSPHTAAVRHFVEAGLAKSGATRPLEVWCDVSPEVARQRRVGRHLDRHPIHDELIEAAEPTAGAAGPTGPLGLGPVLRVDTSTEVDIDRVARWCRDTTPFDPDRPHPLQT